MEKVIQELKEREVGKVLANEPLANHTTMKIGTCGCIGHSKQCRCC